MNATPPQRWADWLRDRLQEHEMTPADLSRASGQREDGSPRPVISRDTVSRWLSGQTLQPTYQLAQLVADLLKEPQAQALVAAGYLVPTDIPSREQPAERAPRPVGPDGDAEEEMVFRLRVPANATPRQREIALRAAQASVRAILAELDDEE